jgi:hypothetical protein
VRPEDLPNLRELAKGKEAESFERLRRTADKYIAAGPTAEPEKMGSAVDKNNAELVKYWWPNREQTMRACHGGAKVDHAPGGVEPGRADEFQDELRGGQAAALSAASGV